MTYTTLAFFGLLYLFTTIYALLAICAAVKCVMPGWRRRRNRQRNSAARCVVASGGVK